MILHMPNGVDITHKLFPELAAQHYQRQIRYVAGPLPVVWISRMDVAPATLLVALALKLAYDLTGQEPLHLSRALWRQFGILDRRRRKRALDALERAGIIRTERPPGQATRIWLLDKP
jgi:hypothetical protein